MDPVTQTHLSSLLNILIFSFLLLSTALVGTEGNTSLAAPGALANRLQRRTARKANEANLDPPNLYSNKAILSNFC